MITFVAMITYENRFYFPKQGIDSALSVGVAKR